MKTLILGRWSELSIPAYLTLFLNKNQHFIIYLWRHIDLLGTTGLPYCVLRRSEWALSIWNLHKLAWILCHVFYQENVATTRARNVHSSLEQKKRIFFNYFNFLPKRMSSSLNATQRLMSCNQLIFGKKSGEIYQGQIPLQTN